MNRANKKTSTLPHFLLVLMLICWVATPSILASELPDSGINASVRDPHVPERSEFGYPHPEFLDGAADENLYLASGRRGGGTPVTPPKMYTVAFTIDNRATDPWHVHILDKYNSPYEFSETVPGKSYQKFDKQYDSHQVIFKMANFQDKRPGRTGPEMCRTSLYVQDIRKRGNHPCFYAYFEKVHIPISERETTYITVSISLDGISLSSSTGANYHWGSAQEYNWKGHGH